MQSAGGPTGASGTAVLTQKAGDVSVAINLSEGSSAEVSQIRQGSCAQLYPEVAYRLGSVVNGAGSGLVRSVQLSYLMNGHFAIVVVPLTNPNSISSCADIPRNT